MLLPANQPSPPHPSPQNGLLKFDFTNICTRRGRRKLTCRGMDHVLYIGMRHHFCFCNSIFTRANIVLELYHHCLSSISSSSSSSSSSSPLSIPSPLASKALFSFSYNTFLTSRLSPPRLVLAKTEHHPSIPNLRNNKLDATIVKPEL